MFTERGEHRGVGVSVDTRQFGDAETDTHTTPAGEGASRGETQTETA